MAAAGLLRRLGRLIDRANAYSYRQTGLTGIGVDEPGLRCGCGATFTEGDTDGVAAHIKKRHPRGRVRVTWLSHRDVDA